MIPFVLVSLAGSALAGMGGHEQLLNDQAFVLKGGHGGRMAPFGGGPLPLGPVILQRAHGPIPQGQPILIKQGLPFPQGPPILLRGPAPPKAGLVGHAPHPQEPALIIKGDFDMGHGGHAPLLQGSPIILKNVSPPQSFAHGPPIIIRGGIGHGAPIMKGPGHTLQGPTILIKGGGPHGLRGGTPLIFKKGFGAPPGSPVIGLGHEQHAVAGPSYLITTVHHVQKVSGGGKLLASFGGTGPAKSIGSLGLGHGGHILNKPW